MAKSIVVEGKTSTEAIEKGLKELGLTKDCVDVKILEEEGKKTFPFTTGKNQYDFITVNELAHQLSAAVMQKEITGIINCCTGKPMSLAERKEPSQNDVDKCKESISKFLDSFCKAYGDITYDIEQNDKDLKVIINDEENTKLIGYRGEVINSIQNLVSTIGNKDTDLRVRVSVDIQGYRTKREKTLKELAEKLEKTVKRTGKKIILEPMPAYERKILHTSLQNSKVVTTYSIGEEPHRKLVIEKK